MSVSDKIKIVSVRHKITIYRVILRGLDRGGQKNFCNCPNWCLADIITTKHCQTQLKRGTTKILGILWLTDISCVSYRHLQNLFKLPILLPKSVWICIRFCLISVFLCTTISIWREQFTWYVFLQLFWFFCCPQIM